MPNPNMLVRQYTLRQLARLDKQRHDSQGRAAMAHLRRGVGHIPGELPALWGSFLAGLPEELRSLNGEPSYAEWAIYTALTLYALHQQGKTDSVQVEDVSLGKAALRLAGGGEDDRQRKDNLQRIWRRLNLVAQADDMQEMSYRLRQLVTLLKAGGVGLDYAMLAADLFEYQFEATANRVRLRWGQDFFHMSKNEEDHDDE